MRHPDFDVLTLLALGHDAEEETTRHLADCSRCRAQVDDLRLAVDAACFEDGPLELTPPRPQVWERIVAEAGLSSASPAPPVTDSDRPSESRPERRTPRLPTWLSVAAGVVVGAAGAGVTAAVLSGAGADAPAGRVIADVALEPMPGRTAHGTAEIRRSDDDRVLDLTVRETGPGPGYQQVWLLDAESGRLVSLGVLADGSGSFTVPAGLDLGDYPLVEISAEPYDGDPAHSGDSLARGSLTS